MLKRHIPNITVIFVFFLSYFIILGSTPNKFLEEYNGVIEHLTFETLISFPEKALSDKNKNATLYEDTKITPTEFTKILQELYSNNYILISLKELCFIENNTLYSKTLFLPKNKKPILLSFNNITYKTSYLNSGEIDKIIIDNNNQFATYSTTQNIQNRIAHDNEFIPILEQFISNNPNFSHNNARGIIFFTIENGILGYNIDSKNASSKHDIKRVTEIVRCLKNKGWEFGSNNYNTTPDISLNQIEFINNITKWKKSISPIITDTPYYSSLTEDNITLDTEKLKVLIDNKFKFFFFDNNTPFLSIKSDHLQMSRKKVNGFNLRNNSDIFTNLFDTKKVYDNQHRKTSYLNNT